MENGKWRWRAVSQSVGPARLTAGESRAPGLSSAPALPSCRPDLTSLTFSRASFFCFFVCPPRSLDGPDGLKKEREGKARPLFPPRRGRPCASARAPRPRGTRPPNTDGQEDKQTNVGRGSLEIRNGVRRLFALAPILWDSVPEAFLFRRSNRKCGSEEI